MKKKKLFLFVSLGILILDAAFVGLVYFNSRDALSEHLARESKKLHQIFELSLHQAETNMLEVASFVAGNPRVQTLFRDGRRAVEDEGGGAGGTKAARARSALLGELLPAWTKVRENFDVRQLHFHLPPDAVSFLRVHFPDRFGDPLGEVRHSLVESSRTQEPTSGFESGRVVSGIRGVVPVFADAGSGEREYIGTLEAGTGFTEMLRTLSETTGASFAVLLFREHLEANLWPDRFEKAITAEPPLGHYYIEATSSPLVRAIMNEIGPRPAEAAGTPMLISIAGTPWAASAMPLRDFMGKQDAARAPVGIILTWDDASSAIAQMKEGFRNSVIAAIIGFFLAETLIFFGLRAAATRLDEVVNQRSEPLRESRDILEQEVAEQSLHLQELVVKLETELEERREAQRALGESEGRLRTLVDHSLQGVIVHNNGIPLFVNDECAKIVGYSKKELLELDSFFALIHPEDRERLRGYTDAREHGQSVPESYEYRAFRKDGREICIYAKATEIKWDGDDAVLGTLIDVSERKKAEAELRQSQKTDALGQLTGGIAHDFNNILTAILGNLELLEDVIDGNGKAAKWLSTALHATDHGAELTRRLLSFSRQQALNPQRVEVGEALFGFLELARHAIPADIDLAIDIPEEIWPLYCDPGELEQALLNLALNARDAMPAGGKLTISAINRAVKVDKSKELPEAQPGSFVAILVSDTGAGMTEEVQERAFEPFFTTKDVGQGTGLGLSSVHGFAKGSGGQISVNSEPGKGTTVELLIPAASERLAKETGAGTSPRNSKSPGGSETVLVVEDDADVRAFAADALRMKGYAVLEAQDGAKALAILSSAVKVDILFSDVVLPGGMSGADLAGKYLSRRPSGKVLLATGYPRDALKYLESLQLKIEVMSKPYGVQELTDAIHRNLGA